MINDHFVLGLLQRRGEDADVSALMRRVREERAVDPIDKNNLVRFDLMQEVLLDFFEFNGGFCLGKNTLIRFQQTVQRGVFPLLISSGREPVLLKSLYGFRSDSVHFGVQIYRALVFKGHKRSY